ncbi:hypothetical protein V8G54_019341, partial [Vigna mungo]
VIVSEVKNRRTKHRTVVINRNHNKPIREWPYRKLRKQCSFRRPNFLTLPNQFHRSDNFHSTLVNFCRNVQYLEKGSLRGIQPCVARRNYNINRCNQPNTSRSSHLVLGNHFADLLHVTFGENQPNITH